MPPVPALLRSGVRVYELTGDKVLKTKRPGDCSPPRNRKSSQKNMKGQKLPSISETATTWHFDILPSGQSAGLSALLLRLKCRRGCHRQPLHPPATRPADVGLATLAHIYFLVALKTWRLAVLVTLVRVHAEGTKVCRTCTHVREPNVPDKNQIVVLTECWRNICRRQQRGRFSILPPPTPCC